MVLSRCRSGYYGREQRLEDVPAVLAAYQGLAAALRVGHHPHHVTLLVDDSGYVADGAVGIGIVVDLASLGAVPEEDVAVGMSSATDRRRTASTS